MGFKVDLVTWDQHDTHYDKIVALKQVLEASVVNEILIYLKFDKL